MTCKTLQQLGPYGWAGSIKYIKSLTQLMTRLASFVPNTIGVRTRRCPALEASVPRSPKNKKVTVNKQHVHEQLRGAAFNAKLYTRKWAFFVIPFQYADILLGLPWAHMHMILLKWKQHMVQFKDVIDNFFEVNYTSPLLLLCVVLFKWSERFKRVLLAQCCMYVTSYSAS